MVRYKIKLTYDGTDFSGFQRQQGRRTVQGVVEAALRKIGWQGESILAAGRTDTGVHAAGQVIAFDLAWGHSDMELQAALNANLPKEVAVVTADGGEPQFHPRYDALAREYVYTLFCQPIRDPLRERYAWRQWPILNLAELTTAAGYLLGQHDFQGFGRVLNPGGSTIREVSEASWIQEGSSFQFTIRANAFLYHMVRRIVYALVLVGRKELEPITIKGILGDPENKSVQGLAPANGLVLNCVIYARDV